MIQLLWVAQFRAANRVATSPAAGSLVMRDVQQDPGVAGHLFLEIFC
jgi:hypothetical protein